MEILRNGYDKQEYLEQMITKAKSKEQEKYIKEIFSKVDPKIFE